MIKVYTTTLAKLFSGQVEGLGGVQQLHIPEYQRPYTWKKKQVLSLVDDLDTYFSQEQNQLPKYYLGSIILHQKNNELNIIDGQQRVTTLLLLQQFMPGMKLDIEYSNPSSVQQIKFNYTLLKDIFNGDYYEHLSLVDLPSKLNFEEINITLVVTPSEDLAYTFFETHNTGGIRLSGSDIVKAHHLRAILNRKEVAEQAKKWERNQKYIDTTIENLTKIRYWDNRYWRTYPFYRDIVGKKNNIIDEFSINTDKSIKDVSYYYQITEQREGIEYTAKLSHLKQARQPLSDGNNTLDYLNDYLHQYVLLFVEKSNYQVDERFFTFHSEMIKDNNGTVYLKDLWELVIMAYISKFGYHQLYEVGLWLFRYIYSKRVTMDRNVREDSVFKFAKEEHVVDTILDVYTSDELLKKLKAYRYTFNMKYNELGQAKDRHLQSLQRYFGTMTKSINEYKSDFQFDKDLILGIQKRLNPNAHV